MTRTEAPAKEVERKSTERVESAIQQNPSDPSPFLKELSSITGPAAGRAVDKLDKDGYTGRAEALQATKILDETKGSIWRHLPFTDNALTRKDIEDYSKRPGLSDGERAIATRLGKDFDKISTDGKSITTDNIAAYQKKEQTHADLTNLYAKDAKGKSLYDSISDGKGGVDGKKLDERMKDPSLSPSDRSSLNAVNGMRDTSYGTPVGDVTKGVLGNATDSAGLTPQERAGKPKVGDPQSAESQRGADALKDLVAKPGNGQSLLDKIGDGKGGISFDKTQDVIAHPERHNLTPENLKTLGYVNDQFSNSTQPNGDLTKQDLQKMGADSGVDYNKLAAKPAVVPESPEQKGREKDFAHLFERSADGKPNLYDRLKSPDGGITGSKLDEELKRPDLSKADRDTVNYLKSLQNDGIIGKKDLTKDDIAARAKEHNMSDAALKKGGLDQTPVPADKPQPQPGTAGEIKPEAHKALTVHSGQGYYHVAERLLSEAHKGDKKYEPSQKELKELVAQLKTANGNRKSLNSKEELKVDDAIRHNPALAGLFA